MSKNAFRANIACIETVFSLTSKHSFHIGLHCENCIVLAEGWYEDKIFHAKAIGFPPAETAETSRAYLGSLNMFGGDPRLASKTNKALKKTLQENKDRTMIFLSDVWLDQDKVCFKNKNVSNVDLI